MAIRLLIARHAETEDNAGGRWQGWSDSLLTARGLAQAHALAGRLAGEPLAAVYSSDLGRALHTACLAAAPHCLTPYPTAALRERNVGVYAGLTGAEVEARFPQSLARRAIDGVLDWAPPRGESFRQMLARLLPALADIALAWPDCSVLIVTHGGVVRLLASHALGAGWAETYRRHPSNCGLSEFLWSDDGTLRLQYFDEHGFLDDDIVPPLAEGVGNRA